MGRVLGSTVNAGMNAATGFGGVGPRRFGTQFVTPRGMGGPGLAAQPFGGADVLGFEAALVSEAVLTGRNIVLRPLNTGDRDHYCDTVERNRPRLDASGTGPAHEQTAPATRGAYDELIEHYDLLRLLDQGHWFALVDGDEVIGEIGLEGVVRGQVQSAFLVLWVDEAHAGRSLAPEAYVLLARHAFEDLGLHRVEAAVLTDNEAVRRALAKLDIRSEGVSPRYLLVEGEWQDHERFILTAEEWTERREALIAEWVG